MSQQPTNKDKVIFRLAPGPQTDAAMEMLDDLDAHRRAMVATIHQMFDEVQLRLIETMTNLGVHCDGPEPDAELQTLVRASTTILRETGVKKAEALEQLDTLCLDAAQTIVARSNAIAEREYLRSEYGDDVTNQ